MQKPAGQLLRLIIFSAIIISLWSVYLFPAQALVTPNVHVIDLKLEQTNFRPADIIKGSFVVFNSEERAINDVTYKFLLFIKDETGIPKVYIDEKVSPERFNLSPGEKKAFSFSYNLPRNISSGVYSFRIALLLTGFPLGWEEKEINIIGGNPFLLIDMPFVIKNNIEESAVVGINFGKGETPRLKFRISNPNNLSLSALTKITIYERATSDTKIESLTKTEITLKSQESLNLIYDLPLYEKPESYLAELQFFDKKDQSLSNKLFFRWVVIGQSGEIIEARTDRESYQKGETAKITICITGPADVVTEPGEGEVTVALLSPENVLVGKAQKKINLSNGCPTITIPINEDVSHPIVKVELKKDNVILDDYLVNTGPELIPEKPEAPLKNRVISYLLIVFVVITFAILLYYFLRKMRFIKIIIFLIIIGGASFLVSPQSVKAAEVEFEQATHEDYIANTWNKPLKNETFSSGDYITFQGAFFIPVCMNALVENTITFYITDYQEQPSVFYKSALPTEESENKKEEILTSGNWIKLGSVYYEGHAKVGLTVEYNQTFKIPDNVPRGDVYARVWFTGAHWNADKRKYNLIVSENIKINSYPSLTNLNVSQPDYCVSGPTAFFSWTFSDPVDTQSAYRVQVDNNSNFSSPEDDSGEVFSDSNSYATPLGKLKYKKTYYWRTKVWGSVNNDITIRARGETGNEIIDLRVNGVTKGTWTLSTNYQDYTVSAAVSPSDTVRVYFTNDNGGNRDVQIDYAIINGATYQAENQTVNTGAWNSSTGACGGIQSEWLHCNGYIAWSISTPSNESDWENGPSFTTPKHTYPSIDFSWSPLNPEINENTLFTDQSTVYGGATKGSWSWIFQDAIPDSSSQQNPTVNFSSVGLKPATLRVTDSDGLSCLGSKTVTVEFPLPEWRETAPSQQ